MPLEPGAGGRAAGRATPRTSTSSTSPKSAQIWSFGSGYGGNALLGKKCFALRIASVMARDEGWLAEHMLILGVERPRRREDLRRRRVPERLRQDELRDAHPAEGLRGLEGHDRRRRHRLDQARARTAALRDQPRGRLLRRRARAPREKSNPNAMATIAANTIFTNVALTDDGDVWWEGMTTSRRRTSSTGRAATGRPAAARAGRASERALHRAGVAVPVDRPGLGEPAGRADQRVHLRRPPSQRHAARVPGVQLEPRRLPGRDDGLGDDGRRRRAGRRCAATRWRCCRSAATTWATTSATGSTSAGTCPNPPRIFRVNWFRRDEHGKFLWPGFGENMRVLKWIVDRVHGRGRARREPARLDAALRGHRLEGPRLPARDASTS